MRPTLTVNLSALVSNYRLLQAKLPAACAVAAVVKADAYGLGAVQVVSALDAHTSVQTYYVATLDEAIALRAATPKQICVLGGVGAGEAEIFTTHHITPVLNSPDQLARWAQHAGNTSSILHLDTGMNRLGLTAGEAAQILPDKAKLAAAKVSMIMSHFTSSEVPDDPMTAKQGQLMAAHKAQSGLPVSLCNSSGIFCAPELGLAHEQARPGAALYGINPWPATANPMQRVVQLDIPVVQIKSALRGESAGYNCTEFLQRDSRLAIVGYGYADGLLRSGSGRVHLYWRDIACKVIGRVSMDFLIVDVTDVPEDWLHDGFMTLLGEYQSADDLADICKTNGYEILTQLRASSAGRIYLPN